MTTATYQPPAAGQARPRRSDPAARPAQQRARGAQQPARSAQQAPDAAAATEPVDGLLDAGDGTAAFLRLGGYQRGPDDVFVPAALIRQHGLRPGDQVSGAARPASPGKGRDQHPALARVDSVNGLSPEQATGRPGFAALTPLHPEQRLRLESPAGFPTARIIDLVTPIGKGQRGLIVSPPKAGKTLVLTAIAAAVAANHPDVHLMVVLVGERPEEVTDLRRSVHGEVIYSTFDQPAAEHIAVAELAIERAKRLVEMGRDVVVLLDSITRLGRAYNLAAPSSSRILAGGVAVGALYPPRKLLGAARNVEDGGSLTLLCTALVETGSRMDDVFFEEFKGTGNMELRLRRDLAEKRIFPAVNVAASSTRRDDLLLPPAELEATARLRRVLTELDPQQAIELLLDKARGTASNAEFLGQVQRAA